MMRYAKRSICVIMASVIMIAMCAPALADMSYVAETHDLVEWRCGDTLIWRFAKSDAAAAQGASDAFNKMLKKGFRLPDLKVSRSDGAWHLMIGSTRLIASAQSHARGSGMDSRTIALMWLSRLYDAIGARFAEPLTDKYKLKGSYALTSKVSWYGGRFVGRKCANGEIFTDTHMSAAAKSLPFGTLVRVTLASGKKSVVVRITDRFAEHRGRALDLSSAAADILGSKRSGIIGVRLEVIGRVDVIREK